MGIVSCIRGATECKLNRCDAPKITEFSSGRLFDLWVSSHFSVTAVYLKQLNSFNAESKSAVWTTLRLWQYCSRVPGALLFTLLPTRMFVHRPTNKATFHNKRVTKTTFAWKHVSIVFFRVEDVKQDVEHKVYFVNVFWNLSSKNVLLLFALHESKQAGNSSW